MSGQAESQLQPVAIFNSSQDGYQHYPWKSCLTNHCLTNHSHAATLASQTQSFCMRSLAAALNSAQEGTGEVKHVLSTATFCPRLPGQPFNRPHVLPAIFCCILHTKCRHCLQYYSHGHVKSVGFTACVVAKPCPALKDDSLQSKPFLLCRLDKDDQQAHQGRLIPKGAGGVREPA